MAIAGVTVQVGGKKRLYRFAYLAMKGVCSDFNLDKIEDLPTLLKDGTKFGFIESLMYHGFRSGCIHNKEEVDFAATDMEVWMDEDVSVLQTVLREAAAQMQASMEGPEPNKKKAAPPAKQLK